MASQTDEATTALLSTLHSASSSWSKFNLDNRRSTLTAASNATREAKEQSAAARKSLAYLERTGNAKPFIDEAQRLIYLKGTGSHDYKFSSAVLEDYYNMTPALRDRYLAASVFWLQGSGKKDTDLVSRTRQALG